MYEGIVTSHKRWPGSEDVLDSLIAGNTIQCRNKVPQKFAYTNYMQYDMLGL